MSFQYLDHNNSLINHEQASFTGSYQKTCPSSQTAVFAEHVACRN